MAQARQGAAQRVPGQRGLPGAARTGAKPARYRFAAPGAAGRSVRRHRLRDPGVLHQQATSSTSQVRAPAWSTTSFATTGSWARQRDQRHGPAAPDGRTRAVCISATTRTSGARRSDAWACCRSTIAARAPTRFPGCSPPTRRSSSCCWIREAPFPRSWRRAPRRWQRPATKPRKRAAS